MLARHLTHYGLVVAVILNRFRLLLLATALCLASTTSAYSAGPTNAELRAKTIAKQGVSLARQGNFERALDKFQQANRLSPNPLYQHNIARSYQHLGNLREAWEYFQEATKQEYRYQSDGIKEMAKVEALLRKTHAQLKVLPIPGDCQTTVVFSNGKVEPPRFRSFEVWAPAGNTVVRAEKTNFKDWMRRLTLVAGESRDLKVNLEPLPQQGHLLVNTNVEGANVFIDHILVGTTPMEKAVLHLTGVYKLRVVAKGHVPHIADITIDQDSTTEKNIVLVSSTTPAPIHTTTPDDGGAMEVWGYATLGAGVVGLGLGTYFQIDANQIANDANKIPKQSDPSHPDNAEFDRIYGQAESQQTNGTITFVAAGALLITGGLLLYFSADDDEAAADAVSTWESPTPTTFQPLISATSDGVGVGGLLRF